MKTTYPRKWGTGMIASSSTFHPHPGRVTGICFVCRMLYLRADCQWRTLAPLFDNGANAAPVSVPVLSAVQALMLAVVALKQPAIEC